MRPVHGPRHGKPSALTQRRTNGKTAGVHIPQQMREIALDGKQPVMFPEGIDKYRVLVVQPGKCGGGLAILALAEFVVFQPNLLITDGCARIALTLMWTTTRMWHN